jgi:hypothetical protein
MEKAALVKEFRVMLESSRAVMYVAINQDLTFTYKVAKENSAPITCIIGSIQIIANHLAKEAIGTTI